MKNVILVMLALLAAGCTPERRPSPWIHGVWMAETLIVADREAYLQEHADGRPPEAFCMVFTQDGKIYRYSKTKGRQRIYSEFRVSGNTLEMSARDEGQFRPMGKLVPPDKLSMDFKRGRKLILRKLPEGTDPDDLDLSGTLLLEFEDGSQQQPEPDLK